MNTYVYQFPFMFSFLSFSLFFLTPCEPNNNNNSNNNAKVTLALRAKQTSLFQSRSHLTPSAQHQQLKNKYISNSPCANSLWPCSEGPIFPPIPGQFVPHKLQHTQPTLCQGTEVKQVSSRHMFVFSCMTGSPRGFQTWLNTTVLLLSTFQAVLEQDHRHSSFGQSQPCSSPLQQSSALPSQPAMKVNP